MSLLIIRLFLGSAKPWVAAVAYVVAAAAGAALIAAGLVQHAPQVTRVGLILLVMAMVAILLTRRDRRPYADEEKDEKSAATAITNGVRRSADDATTSLCHGASTDPKL